MPQPSTIKDCMRRKPLTINPDANLVEAIEIIFEYKLTGLTVTDSSGQVVGILSELDCIKAVLTAIYNEGDPEHSLVRDVMCKEIVSCRPDDGIVEVAQAMLETRQRRRPVMEDGRLVGQVSSSNILWALMEHSRRKLYNSGRKPN
jgi:CBS domain-containing protein